MAQKAFFLFPGQGAQFVGMLKPWLAIPQVVSAIDVAQDVLQQPLKQWLLTGPETHLNQTAFAQPALLALGFGAAQFLQDHGIEPVAAAGHSLGEITALAVAGVFTLADAIYLSHERGKAMQMAVKEGEGAMLALLSTTQAIVDDVIAQSCQTGVLALASANAHDQFVLSGTRAAIEKAEQLAKQKGVRRTKRLSVSAPFHSPLMESAAQAMPRILERISIGTFAFPVWSNVTLKPYANNPQEVHLLLKKQVTAPVKWRAQIEQMHPTVLGIELAPAGVLRSLCQRTLPQWRVEALATPDDLANCLCS